MKAQERIISLVAFLVLLVTYYLTVRHPFERYTVQDANVDEILKLADEDGEVIMYTYLAGQGRPYKIKKEKDGFVSLYGSISAKTDDDELNETFRLEIMKERYMFTRPIDKETGDFIKVEGNYPTEHLFRIVNSITGHKGYYSLRIGKTNRYFFLDPLVNEGGIIDLGDKRDYKEIEQSKSINFQFGTPGELPMEERIA